MFDGYSCAARPTANAPCRLEFDCPATWIGRLPHPHRESRRRQSGRCLAGEVDVAGQCVCVGAVGLVDVAVVAGAEDADPDGGVARLVLQGDRAGVGRLAARVVLARDLRARAALRLVDGLAGEVAVAGQRVRVGAVGLVDVAVVTRAQDPDPDSRVARLVLCSDGEGAGVLPVAVRLACDLGAGLAAAGRGQRRSSPALGLVDVWPVRLMLPASAFASALLDWWTLPSSPGLRTRIPTAVLLGLSCRATAAASADWPLELSWPATCVPDPLCDWSIDWPVRLPLPASAFASALLDWRTLPSSPGLRTRIPTAVLLGLSCAATARAPASCQLLVRLACDLGAGLAAAGRGQRRSSPALGLVDVLAGEVDVAGQCVCVCAVGLVDVAVVAGAEDADPDGGVARLVLQGDPRRRPLAARVVLARDLRAGPALRLVDRWPVRLPLPASAFASALLDWPTLPSSPGLGPGSRQPYCSARPGRSPRGHLRPGRSSVLSCHLPGIGVRGRRADGESDDHPENKDGNQCSSHRVLPFAVRRTRSGRPGKGSR